MLILDLHVAAGPTGSCDLATDLSPENLTLQICLWIHLLPSLLSEPQKNAQGYGC